MRAEISFPSGADLMQTHLLVIFVLTTIAVAAIAADRSKLPPAIVMVLVGLVLALTPGLPRIELAPELVLLLVLPPLVYSAGVTMSWREFRYNIRSISLLAVGGVTFTTVAVAAVVHFLLDWDWAAGFVLGAIISPPDEVAPMAIARRLGLPRRTMVVLEGEGLANDATALILYKFAVAAVATGTFSLGSAFLVFLAIVGGRDRVRGGGRLCQPAAAEMGGGSAHRDPAVAADAVRRLLAAGLSGRLRGAGGLRLRTLRQLERAAAHSGRDPAAGHLLLGLVDLCAGRHAVPADRPRGASAARAHRAGIGRRARGGGAGHHRGGDRGALSLDLSGHLPAAPAGARRCAARIPTRSGSGPSSCRSPACAGSCRWRQRWRCR